MARLWCEERSPYEVLGLHEGPDASEQEIRKVYRVLALKLHPDKNPDADPAGECSPGQLEESDAPLFWAAVFSSTGSGMFGRSGCRSAHLICSPRLSR
eukprot:evm.model.scf_473.3 EVM.evm.TU.scf_473.3   scf_473:4029-4483(+)